MKTIAIDIRLIGKNRTGDEAVFRNLVRSVLEADHVNRYVLLTDQSENEVKAVVVDAVGQDGRLPENASIVVLKAKGKFMWNLVAVPLFLIRNQVDVFHTQYILPWYIPSRTKVVTHIHDVSFRAFPKYIRLSDRLFLGLFFPRTMRRSDVLVAPSAFTRDEIVARYGVAKERIAIVPNAVDPDFLRPTTSDDRARVKSRYRLPETFILSAGSMQPRKNIPFLIEAFERVKKDIPGLKLVLVGGKGGKHYDLRIDSVVRDRGLAESVLFPGYVRQEDMSSLYATAAVMAFPSKYEGFGIPVLEAFASAVPVVASDIVPFREVGGNAISYFDPTDVAACAESLYTLLIDENARRRQNRSGKERLLDYSWDRSARVMVSLYASL
ncbi:MAG: glycosyltransferase family 4 protein [Candidatus Moranbacteria bacterium]|nr:glycosyltransferase family 4 protein [Candidatus Moranbacteria bacterium]